MDFSRDFTRAVYLTNAVRLAAPRDPTVVEASDYLAAMFLQRPTKEPRGLVNAGSDVPVKELAKYVGEQGLARMRELGVKIEGGKLVEPTPGVAGRGEGFVLSGVPEGVEYFAARSFDDSWNRSKISNVARAN